MYIIDKGDVTVLPTFHQITSIKLNEMVSSEGHLNLNVTKPKLIEVKLNVHLPCIFEFKTFIDI